MPVNPDDNIFKSKKYAQYFYYFSFAIIVFILIFLLSFPIFRLILYPLAIYYFVKSNVNIEWWHQKIVILLFSLLIINVLITLLPYHNGLLSPYITGVNYLSILSLFLATFYLLYKWKEKFIKEIIYVEPIRKNEIVSRASIAIIVSLFVASAIWSVGEIYYLYRDIILHSRYDNFQHNGIRGKIYDGVGVTVKRLSGYGETNERVDVVTVCNKSSHPIKASVSNYDLTVKMHSFGSRTFSGQLSPTGLSGEKLNPGMCVHSQVVYQTPTTTVQGYLAVQVNGNTYNLLVR